jgi:hypothetical protein
MEKAMFRCIIYANCQGSYISHLLRMHPSFSRDFEIQYYVNYQDQVPSCEELRGADLFIYQPLSSKHRNAATDYLLQYLPDKCIRISISYLTCDLYWPFSLTPDPRNKISSEYPFGPFPYGDTFVLDRLADGVAESSVWKQYVLGHHLTDEQIYATLATSYYARQKDLDSRRDQKIADYVMDNYKTKRLFDTPNHPSAELAVFQVRDILEKCGYGSDIHALDRAGEYADFMAYSLNQVPIHPVAAEKGGFLFGANYYTSYQFWGKQCTFPEYAAGYICVNPDLAEALSSVSQGVRRYSLHPQVADAD